MTTSFIYFDEAIVFGIFGFFHCLILSTSKFKFDCLDQLVNKEIIEHIF